MLHQQVTEVKAGIEKGEDEEALAHPRSQVGAGVGEEMIDGTTEDEMIETETTIGTDAGISCLEANDTCKTRDIVRREESDPRGTRSGGTRVADEETGAAALLHQRGRSP